MVEHKAGQDLSNELENAPHDEGLLIKFPIIGLLKK